MIKIIITIIFLLIFVIGLVACNSIDINNSPKKKKEKSKSHKEIMNLELVNNNYFFMIITEKYEEAKSNYKEIGYKLEVGNKTEDIDLFIGLNSR